ncbi:MAG: protein-glutamate O-methyltransferase CheR [Desulfobulbaceae bacterium]|nr:protein-glutamate O-methyltransferase CheR [Desulfobulbaceae bacterium]HIJ77902.1 protein-glutamate O-methyltransferase CheR [Deltaproteobacteria bacterium]
MRDTNIEDIELELLLEGIFQRYGYDFRHYSRASIKRRVKHFMAKSGQGKISEVTTLALHDSNFFQQLVEDFSVPVTEMFRDPDVYQALREKVLPRLATYPFIKIWHAGCASGEEVYSLAILLKEEGLYERTTIYATDFNEIVLAKAKQGIYPLADVKRNIENYRRAGGKGSLAEYFDALYDSIIMSKTIKKNITFARHNLAIDQVFGEMNLILCRNVLIYFDKMLQERVLHLFNDSIIRGGFLCLGKKESLQFFEIYEHYKDIDSSSKIYQKKQREQPGSAPL